MKGAIVILASILATRSASAQCQPHWAPFGLPGISRDYVGAFTVFDDGSGPSLYAGGSFHDIAGVPSTFGIARWDVTSETWVSLENGIQPNQGGGFLTCMRTFNTGSGVELIAAGYFAGAGSNPDSQGIARWNGTTWSGLGTGWTANDNFSVWAMTEWRGRLYVGGRFTRIGQVAANGIASWSPDEGWAALGGGLPVPSWCVWSMAVHNDGSAEALYVGGRFLNMDGVPGTSLIAKWKGTTWASVGGGLAGATPDAAIEAMAVFNDGSGPALYAGGGTFATSPGVLASVAKWNGSQWIPVGQNLDGRTTCLAAFDDGTGMKLYSGGAERGPAESMVRLENGLWQPLEGGLVGPGLFPAVYTAVMSLHEWNGELFAGGNFTGIGTAQASGIAVRERCPCYANCDSSTTAPVLNANDFLCFLTRFAAGNAYANCDGSTLAPVLTGNDFQCFLFRYVAGCS